MNRRSVAGFLALGLLVALLVVAGTRPVPWVTYVPGPTVNVLGSFEKKPIIEVQGRPTYRDNGSLRLVTVVPNGGPGHRLNLLQFLTGWIDPNTSVFPYDAIYEKGETTQTVRQQGLQQMVSSQDNAVAAALRALHIPYTTAVRVDSVTKKGAADGLLLPGDVVRRANGTPTPTPESLVKVIRPLTPGSMVRFDVRRKGALVTVPVTTRPAPDDHAKSVVSVQIAPSYDFPLRIKVNLSDNIGGPSAGMMFALGIIDVLTKGSLTHGRTIAGTGEIDGSGKVLPIGGIEQKIVGAQRDGAGLFLVPADNCGEAVRAHYDHDKVRLVKVTTLEDALASVRDWAADPTTKLTRCSA